MSQIWLYLTASFITRDVTRKHVKYCVRICGKLRYLENVWPRRCGGAAYTSLYSMHIFLTGYSRMLPIFQTRISHPRNIREFMKSLCVCFVCLCVVQQPKLLLRRLTVEDSTSHTITHTHTQTVRLLRTSNQLSQRPLPTQSTTNITDQHPCAQYDSNSRSQHSSGCRRTH